MAWDDIQGNIGVTLLVALGVPATYDEAGFDTVQASAILVGEIETISEFGGTATVETFASLATGKLRKAVGIIDYGQAALTLGKVKEDVGQALLKSGFDGTNARQRHSAIVTYPDGEREAFTFLITSNTSNIGSAGPFIRASVNLELDDQVLELDPYTP